MAYIRNCDGRILQASTTFVQACGLLRNLDEIIGRPSSESDPVPIENMEASIMDDLMEFERRNVIPEPLIERDRLPESVLGLFRQRAMHELVQLWSAADFMDYTYAQEAIAAYMASKLAYAEPSMAAAMFGITEELSSEQLEDCMKKHPFLREI